MSSHDPLTSPVSFQAKGESTLEKRLTSYGVMSLALAAATTGGPQPAYAGVIEPPISTSTTGQVVFSMGGHADVNSFGGADFALVGAGSQALLAAFAGRAFLAGSASGVPFPALLHSGTRIGTAGQILGTGPGGLKFVTAPQTLAGTGGAGWWFPASQRNQFHFLGLRFDVGGQPHYGWAEIQVGADYNITLRNVYGDLSSANMPLAAGATPEPSSALLLALGATG